MVGAGGSAERAVLCCAMREQEPLGEVERRAEDAGPATRNRRRPEPVDPSPPETRLPLHAEDPEALRREVASRKGC